MIFSTAMQRICNKDKILRHLQSKGFTLIELIVALAVVSIAITVLVQLFTASLNLVQSSQNAVLASNIAFEKLNFIKSCPEKFIWKVSESANSEGVFPILTSEDEPKTGNPVEVPVIAPPDWASFRKYKNVSQKFRWKAFGKPLAEDKENYEVIVTVIYRESGRIKSFISNTVIPRFQIEKVVKK